MAAVIIAAFVGGFIALMLELNGRLMLAAGDWPAVVFVHLAGVTSALLYLCIIKISGKPAPGKAAHPQNIPIKFWFLPAGSLGILVVIFSNYGFAQGGLVFSMAGVLAGQTVGAALLEQLPLFGDHRSPLRQHVTSLSLIVPGALIVTVTGNAPLSASLAVWSAGGLLMIQSLMNSRMGSRYGTPIMVTLNYATALIVIAGITFAGGGPSWTARAALIKESVEGVSYGIIVGGGGLGVLVIAAASILYAKAGALKVMLAIYLGQLGFGILFDLAAGRPIPVELYVGITMVFAGLAAGKKGLKVKPESQT